MLTSEAHVIKDTVQSILTPEAKIVRDRLKEKGLETPIIPNSLTADEKYKKIKGLMTEVLDTLGLDLEDDSDDSSEDMATDAAMMPST